jgi:signal transduction histidine kinase
MPRQTFTPLHLALAGVVVLAVLLGVSFASLRSFDQARALSDKSAQIERELAQFLQFLSDAETGQRGYLLTGQATYLDPYDSARKQLPSTIERLERLESDDPAQRARLAELETLAQVKLDELGRTVELQRRHANGSALALVQTGEGKRVMDAFRQLEATVVSEEGSKLAHGLAAARRLGRLTFASIAVALLSLLVLGVLLQAVGRELARRKAADVRMADLEHFAGRISHDVRSPLASVSLALELAKRRPMSPEVPGVLDEATATLERVGTLVNGLLMFSTAGVRPADGARASLKEVLGEVVQAARPAALENHIDLRLEDIPPARVAASPGVLNSIVCNLVDNAIKYMGTCRVRRVIVRAKQRGSRVRTEVRDTGQGVPRELASSIFEPHLRGPESDLPRIGLGLATVRRLCEAHGGAVGMVRMAAGTLFWFELPLLPVADLAIATHDQHMEQHGEVAHRR